MGKQLIIVGADFSAVAIDSRQAIPFTTNVASISIATTGTTTQSLTITTSLSSGVTWTVASGNTGVATVSGSGLSYIVTAAAVGSTNITVTATPTGATAETYRTTIKNIPVTVTGVSTGYTITCNITEGTAVANPAIVQSSGSSTITITASSGHTAPASVNDITVTNATKGTYSNGVLQITDVTGDVIVTATCPASGSITWAYRAGWTEPLSSSSRFIVGYHLNAKNNGFAMQLPAGTYNRLELAVSGEYTQSGTVLIGKAAAQGGSTISDTRTMSFDLTSTDSYQIITLSFEPITFTASNFLVIEPSIDGQAFGSKTGSYDLWYGTRPVGNTHPGFYNRVPVVPTGGSSSAWFDAQNYSIDFGIGYAGT